MTSIDNLFENETELQLVVFQLGKEEYGIPIKIVQEIIMPQEMTKIPRAPKFIEGVINLRGNIVPVIDGCKRFQVDRSLSGKTAADERIVVIDIDKQVLGIIVNDVSEVINVAKAFIDSNPASLGDDSELIIGIAKIDKRLLILLNPSGFLDMSEMASLANIANSIKSSVKEPPSIETKAKPLKKTA